MTPMKAVAVYDEKNNVYTAFFKDYPGVMAQAKSREELTSKLSAALASFVRLLEKRNGQGFEIEDKVLSHD